MRAASRNWTQIVGAAAALFALVAGTVLTSTARVQAQDAAGGSVWAGVYTEEQAKRGEAAGKRAQAERVEALADAEKQKRKSARAKTN